MVTTKSNIYYVNFEWLGVGDVEFGIVVDAAIECLKLLLDDVGRFYKDKFDF